MIRHAIRSVGLIAGVIMCAVPVHAQGGPAILSPASDARDCVAKIPAKDLTRLTVVATASVSDSIYRRVPPVATKLLEQVASRFRMLLGATGTDLPDGEPMLSWREIDPAVQVTGYRDGHLAARVLGDSAGAVKPHAAAARLLVRALSEEAFRWPDSFGDSVTFRVDFDRPTIDVGGNIKPLPPPPEVPFGTPVAHAVPFFTVNAPRFTPAESGRPDIRYPPVPQAQKVEGTITMTFVVDSTGRLDKSTFRDVWPDRVARPEGETGEYYRQFIEAIKAGLSSARYVPAKQGGCPIRQLVNQQFVFGVRR